MPLAGEVRGGGRLCLNGIRSKDSLEDATDLARALHVPPNRIYQILNGKRAMTADTALRLSQWLGTSPELWINLQKMYELRVAERQAGEEIRRSVKRWSLPVGPGST